MRILYSLILSMFFCLTLGAQTVWTGDIDSDWMNTANWSAGVPTTGMTVTIPGTPSGGNFPVYSGSPILDFTIQNAGSITFDNFVYNNGTIVNFTNGTLVNNNNYFVNAGSVVFDNDGTFTNTGTFENFGVFDNAASAVFNNNTGATLINHGFFRNNGLLQNDGSIQNYGDIRSTNNLQNNGTINNNGNIENPNGSVVTNAAGGNLINASGSEFSHNDAFQNDGTISNNGKFSTENSGQLTNAGSFTNTNDHQVSGTFLNNNTATNNATVTINDAGQLDNKNNFANNGTITTSICGIILQDSPTDISGPVLHDGIIYEIQGNVQETILEFGEVYTDINQTKPPVAGCKSGATVVLDENGQGTLDLALVDKGSYASCGATVVSRTIEPSTFTTADLGAQNVTLTIEDNLGVVSTCDAVIFVVEYVPPIEAIDDEDIEFACPTDITVTPEPGQALVAVSWDEPAAPTTTCTVEETCATRTASNTTQCNGNNNVYGAYFKFDGIHRYYAISNAVFTENLDGTANFTAHITNNENSNYQFDLEYNLTGRTSTEPAGSPKANICENYNANDWYYYPSGTGSLTGTAGMAGASVTFTDFGEAFQLGNGANVTDGTNGFGGSGWLEVTIISQPTSGPSLSVENDGNPQDGDINIMLSGDGSECTNGGGGTNCNDVNEDISGFIYLGEFNNAKYFISDHPSNWTTARSNSESNGGYLVSINSAEENNFIQSNINPTSGSIWTGLANVNSPGEFQWINGDAVTYTNWQPGEPGGGNDKAARLKKSSGEWTDRNIHNYSYEYVMEIPCSNTGGGNGSCEDVVLDITFDNYPEDVSWEIRNSSNAVVASGGNYGNEPDGSSISVTTCLEDGCYDFIISDSYGDGICCQYGNGSYTLTGADGTVYGTGGDYGNGETTNFCISIDNGGNGGGGGTTNDPVVEQISGPANGDDFVVGVTEIAYRVTDDCGNEEICIFTVTVEDNPAEITANCPANVTVDAAPGASSATVTWDDPTGTTTCYIPGVEVSQIDSLYFSGDELPVGVTFIPYNLVDSCNNFAQCLLTITVNGQDAVLSLDSCPGDITTDTDNFTWDLPTASTTCFTGSVEIEQVEGPAIGSNPGEGTFQIAYLINDNCGNSDVCVFNVTVSPTCPAAGTPCDDGDACTTGDVEDGNCNCAGTFIDSDGDGVCDADDICEGGDDNVDTDGDGTPDFCDDCSTVGQSCDDGDACTTGDVFDANCNCAGTLVDSDGDGVCDADDICEGGDDNVDTDGDGTPDFCDDCSTVGQSCDDGDACTTGDVFDANCNCAGTLVDSDGDGVCDADDICEGGDDNVDTDGDGTPDFCDDCSTVGQSCDDGDACTTGDVFDANCNCAGTLVDSDGDGVCDADDICEGGDDNVDTDGDGTPDFCDDCSTVGQSCDDGDACTTGDVFDANCNCAGTLVDSDGDGVCDADDICEGGDDNVDTDGDGTPDFCDDCSTVGQSCDDGDACTTGDVFDANCNCAGTLIDSDGDGVCDADDICEGGNDNVDTDGDGTPDFCDDDEPSGDPCGNLVITANQGNITVSNIDAPIFNVFIFNSSWGTEYNCNYACTDPTSVDLAPGTYFVKVSLRDASWQEICEVFETVVVSEGCAFNPGDSCDDGDACTTGDVYDDNCNCAGTLADSDNDGVCDADDVCPGFDDNVDTDGDTIPDGCDTNECDNVTYGGLISGDESSCTSFDPAEITVQAAPSGGSGTIEYIWLASTTGCPTDTLLAIPGATGATYDPGMITETTYYLRCSRRGDCSIWAGESNCIVKTVDNTDTDGDGVCDLEDICEGGDDNADNDGDGTPNFCDDTPDGSGDPCENIQLVTGPGSITVSNIDAPIFNIFVFTSGWATEYNCNYNCTDPTTIDVAPGTYYVKVSLRDAGWQEICEIFETVVVTEGCAFNPGDSCDDGDACTTGDVYDEDCNCAGTLTDSDNDGVCDADDVCPGFDDNVDSDGDSIPDGCDTNECDNVTSGGEIAGAESGCSGYDPAMITVVSAPSGGSGGIFYIWLSSTNGCPTQLSQTIPGATGATYDPGTITETTYFVRCSRRSDCDDWTQGESNCVVKTVDDTDTDGDGVCDLNDICEGGDDFMDNDGDGTPNHCDDTPDGGGDPCENVEVNLGDGSITITNIDAPIFTVLIFNSQWQTVYNCGFSCTDPAIATDLPTGLYHITIKLYDGSWNQICEIKPKVDVVNSQGYVAGEDIFDFQAYKNGREVRLNWLTNSEVRNDHFIVERSYDGVNYETMMNVNSITDNTGAFNYVESDLTPYLGENFYRLTKVHKDGTTGESAVRRVTFDLDLSATALFPNPATKEVYVDLEEFEGRSATIMIFNHLGQQMDVKVIDVIDPNPIRFDLSRYTGGAYTMYIDMEGTKNFARKFIVSKL